MTDNAISVMQRFIEKGFEQKIKVIMLIGIIGAVLTYLGTDNIFLSLLSWMLLSVMGDMSIDIIIMKRDLDLIRQSNTSYIKFSRDSPSNEYKQLISHADTR